MNGVIASIEMIDGEGRKSFLAHGTTKGGWWATQPMPDGDGAGITFWLGEGVGTASSPVQAVPGSFGVAALMDSNLPAVARMLRELYPAADVCVLADLLPNGKPNRYAVAAARAVGGRLFEPDFGPNRQPDQKDTNDLFCLLGPEELARQLANARRVEPETATQTAPQDKKPVTYSLRELMQRQFEDVAFLVFGMLTQGVYILGGKPKVGKSWLSLHLLLCIAYGLRVFGTLPSTKGMALYISLEDHDRRLWKRVKQILRQEPTDDLHFTTLWPRIGQGCVEQLDEWLTDHAGTKLIIIDTLARIKPPRAKNGDIYAEDYAAVSAFKELSERHGITVILVHHLRKAGSDDPTDTLSGTTGLAGGVDGTLILTRKTGSKALTLHRSGRDLIDDEPLTLDWDRESGAWTALDAATAATLDISEAQQPIIDALKAHGYSMSRQEIADSTAKDPESIRKTLYRMVERGILIKSGPRNATRYSIAAHTLPEENKPSCKEGDYSSGGDMETGSSGEKSVSHVSHVSHMSHMSHVSQPELLHVGTMGQGWDKGMSQPKNNESSGLDEVGTYGTHGTTNEQNDSEPDYEDF